MQRVILPWSRKVSRWSVHTFCYFVAMLNHAECSMLRHVLCLNLCAFTWLSLVAVMTYCARLEHSLAARIIFQENNSGYFTINFWIKKKKKKIQLKTISPTSDLFLYTYLLIFWTSFPLDMDKSQCRTSVSFPLSVLHRHPLPHAQSLVCYLTTKDWLSPLCHDACHSPLWFLNLFLVN